MEQIQQLMINPEAWAALATLIVLEVVLGIDNLIFISVLTNRLPEAERPRARFIGISLALILRLALLGLLFVIVGLTAPVVDLFGHGFSWRDMILIAGGLFLVWKATTEIHHNVDRNHKKRPRAGPVPFSVSLFCRFWRWTSYSRWTVS